MTRVVHSPVHGAFRRDFKVLLLGFRSSVVWKAMWFALPCAALALTLKIIESHIALPKEVWSMPIMNNAAAFSGFSTSVCFLFVFRTSQAYSRFWEGCTAGHRMFAEWFDFASSVIAFTRKSKAGDKATKDFLHNLVRVVSLLHACAVGSLRGMDGTAFEFIDLEGLDAESVSRALSSDYPVTLICQWVLELVIDAVDDGIVVAPPPIVSRCFQEFANGVVAFHEAEKIQTTRFPLPYQKMMLVLLIIHWVLTPFLMVMWVNWATWVFLLTFVQIWFFWSLYYVATAIEYPFHDVSGSDSYEGQIMQKEFNRQLLILLDPITRNLPKLSGRAKLSINDLHKSLLEHYVGGDDGTPTGTPTGTATGEKLKMRSLQFQVFQGGASIPLDLNFRAEEEHAPPDEEFTGTLQNVEASSPPARQLQADGAHLARWEPLPPMPVCSRVLTPRPASSQQRYRAGALGTAPIKQGTGVIAQTFTSERPTPPGPPGHENASDNESSAVDYQVSFAGMSPRSAFPEGQSLPVFLYVSEKSIEQSAAGGEVACVEQYIGERNSPINLEPCSI